MTATGPYLIGVTLASVVLLLVLILGARMHAFLALVVSSMALGLAAGLPPAKVLESIQKGLGDALGFIAVVIALGAMLGRFLEYSGGGRQLALWLIGKFGQERAAWAVLTGAFLVGLPIFFDVAFIILAPVVWNLGRTSRRSILFYGLPVAAALTVTHALVPPHPAPAAAAQILGADMGVAMLYGILLSIPMVVLGGMVYGTWIAQRIYVPVPPMAEQFARRDSEANTFPPPSVATVLFLLLLPIGLILAGTVAQMSGARWMGGWRFLGHPFTALVLATLLAMWVFGLRRGLNLNQVTRMASESLEPVASLMLITGAGGAFKQVIVDCGVGAYAGQLLASTGISPLLVAYLITLALRVAQGSATVAIITAAGILAPIVRELPGYRPEIVLLAVACGGTALSHVNDSGFWIVNQYLGMSVSDTLRSWTVMKILVSLAGIAIVILAHRLGA